MQKLYLDDIRNPKTDGWSVARSVKEARLLIAINGMPSHISFDHDLGLDDFGDEAPTGYDLAKALVELDLDGWITFPEDFTFGVHSANPVGAENIYCLLNNYLEMKNG